MVDGVEQPNRIPKVFFFFFFISVFFSLHTASRCHRGEQHIYYCQTSFSTFKNSKWTIPRRSQCTYNYAFLPWCSSLGASCGYVSVSSHYLLRSTLSYVCLLLITSYGIFKKDLISIMHSLLQLVTTNSNYLWLNKVYALILHILWIIQILSDFVFNFFNRIALRLVFCKIFKWSQLLIQWII